MKIFSVPYRTECRLPLRKVYRLGHNGSVIAATMEASEALGLRFDPLGGDCCGCSRERSPRAFVRSDDPQGGLADGLQRSGRTQKHGMSRRARRGPSGGDRPVEAENEA